MFFGLDNARTGDEEEVAGADLDAVDLKAHRTISPQRHRDTEGKSNKPTTKDTRDHEVENNNPALAS
jgi:hypothetical protein